MCVGIPLRVISVDGIVATASAADGSDTQLVDLSLTGPVEPGTWVLTHLGSAREVLTPEDAAMIAEAVDALKRVMGGGSVGDAFADIDARTPQLPPHLEAARAKGQTTA